MADSVDTVTTSRKDLPRSSGRNLHGKVGSSGYPASVKSFHEVFRLNEQENWLRFGQFFRIEGRRGTSLHSLLREEKVRGIQHRASSRAMF